MKEIRRLFLKVCLSFLLLINLQNPLLAQESYTGSYFTDGKLNGEYWVMLNTSEKKEFVTGMIQGIVLCSDLELAYIKGGVEQKQRADFLQNLANNIPTETNVSEIVKFIDSYYSDQTNIGTPISTTYFTMNVQQKK